MGAGGRPTHGWTLVARPPPGQKGAVWAHRSGWRVSHCSHRCALYPYTLHDPEHPEAGTMSANGLGFAHLATAMRVVERILAGELVTTDERCAPGWRVVVGVCSFGLRREAA
jgi:hypothetical protein